MILSPSPTTFSPTAITTPVLTVRAGTPIHVVPAWQQLSPIKKTSLCTIGAVTHRGWVITAGHCGDVGAHVFITDRHGRFHRIGTIHDRTLQNGDFGIIQLNRGIRYIPTHVSYRTPAKGTHVYKIGSVTGKTPGRILTSVTRIDSLEYPLVPGGYLGTTYTASTLGQLSTVCSRQGDSGGPIITQQSQTTVAIVVGTGSSNHPDASHMCSRHEVSLIAPLSQLPHRYQH